MTTNNKPTHRAHIVQDYTDKDGTSAAIGRTLAAFGRTRRQGL